MVNATATVATTDSFFAVAGSIFLWSNRKNADDSGAEMLTVTVEKQHSQTGRGWDTGTGMEGEVRGSGDE